MTRPCPAPHPPHRRFFRCFRLFPLLLACLLTLTGCPGDRDDRPKERKRPTVPVTIAQSRTATVPVELTATAHIESPAAVAVRSRVTGTLDKIHFTEGQEVEAGALLFTIDPRPFAAVLARAEAPLVARIIDPANGSAPLSGTLSFIDNTVDPATGAIRLIATFANNDRALWPGQMVDLRLLVTERPDCVVVPARAVQTGQQGPYVFVVKADATVAVRPVTPGLAFGEELVIDQGLAAGERVVTDGQLLLADGVSVQERTPAGAPARPAANAAQPAGKAP